MILWQNMWVGRGVARVNGNLKLTRAVVRRSVSLVSLCMPPLVGVVAQKGCGRLEPFLVLLKAPTKEAAACSAAKAQRNALVGLSPAPIEDQNSFGNCSGHHAEQ